MIDMLMVFLKSGGSFMYPIALVGVIGIAVVVERLAMIFIYKRSISNDMNEFSSNISSQPEIAMDTIKNSDSILGRTLKDAIDEYQNLKINKEEFEELVGINAVASIRRLSRRTSVISTFANIATLLGLLGTIMGLIQSFSTVSQAGAGGDHLALLSSAVSIAMNTTAFGLMVAIPLLLVYVFVDNISNKALENLQVSCAIVTNKLYSVAGK